MTTDTFKKFREKVINGAKASNNRKDLKTCVEVFNHVNTFLQRNNVIPASAALERLDATGIVFNNKADLVADIGLEKIEALVENCKVPMKVREQTVLAIGRILSGGTESISDYFSSARDDRSLLSTVRVVGPEAVGSIMKDQRDVGLALESFGVDMDRVAVDNRLNIAVTLLRAHKSLIERVLPRVPSETNVVTVKIPAPEVYSLETSQNPSSAIRNNPANRTQFVQLYRTPDFVNTAPQEVVFNPSDDTGSFLYSGADTTTLNCGKQANLFDLSLNNLVVGYGNVDFTDLISEGGAVENVVLSVTATVSGSPVTETFLVPTRYIAGARFSAISNTSLDSGDRTAVFKVVFSVNSTTLTAAGSATSIFSTFVLPEKANITIQFNANLNLKNGNISGMGSASGVAATTNSTTPTGSLVTAVAGMSFSVVAFEPDLFFSEENLRKTNIAVRMNERQQYFEIPVGRMFVVDFSLQQQTPEDVLTTMSNTMSIGNDARSLSVITSVMNNVSNQLIFMAANPDLDWTNSPAMDYAAGTICLPFIITNTSFGSISVMDFSNIAVFRESERLTEIHGRLRALLLSMTALIHTNSLYLENLGPNEQVVYKVITSTVIKDVLFNIPDYHNALADKAQLNAESDYSMMLPNGVRLDIVATNFVNYADTIIMFPIREMIPEHVTSFATLQDSGTFIAQYTPVANNAANKRVVTSSREIPFVTNPIGALVTITGISADLPLLSPLTSSSP